MTDRLEAQFAFLREADRLKSVLRASRLIDGSRPENSAEHSWHIMLYALVLADQAGPEVSIPRVLQMLLIHDIVEIDAGDTPIHGDFDPAEQAALEEAASYPHVTSALAELKGISLSFDERRKNTDDKGGVNSDVIALSQRFAVLMAEYQQSIDDGVITVNEAKRLLKETTALQQVLIDMKLHLEDESV